MIKFDKYSIKKICSQKPCKQNLVALAANAAYYNPEKFSKEGGRLQFPGHSNLSINQKKKKNIVLPILSLYCYQGTQVAHHVHHH